MKAIIEAYRFFHANAGYVVGRRALGAISLARAERIAKARGWSWSWEWDEDHDRGPADWGASEADVARWECSPHECLGCVLKDAEGHVLGSLWGIWDPSASYRRVVESELAGEAFFELQRDWGASAHSLTEAR